MGNFCLKTKKKICSICQKEKTVVKNCWANMARNPRNSKGQGQTHTLLWKSFFIFFWFNSRNICTYGAFVSFFTSLIFREIDVYKYYTGESKLDLGSAHGTRITLPSRRLMHVRSTFEIGSLGKSSQSRRGQNVSICFSVGVHLLVVLAYVCLESQKPISKKHASASLGFVLFVWI